MSGEGLDVLGMISDLCGVIEAMSKMIRDQAAEIEQARIAEAVRENLRRRREDIESELDALEIRLRRLT